MNQSFPKVIVIFILIILSSCYKHAKVQEFGEKVDSTIAFSINDLDAKMTDKLSLKVTVSGYIQSFCKADGCWLKLTKEKNGPLLVRIKDKSIFVSEKIDGKYAFVKGVATYQSLPLQETTESISENEKQPTSIDNTIEPKTELVVEATGIMIR